METMTSRQRLLVALQGGTPDRVPVAPFGWGKVDPDSAIGKELIAKTDPFISVGSGGDPFLGEGVRRTTRQEGNTTITLIHTPKGELVQRHQRTEVTAATVEFPCKSAADVEALLALPYQPPDIDLTRYRQWRERVGEEALVMVGIGNAVCFPAAMLAPQDFCLLWADAPELMVRMTATAAQRLNAHLQRLCQAGVDAFRIVGGEYVTVQLGPQAFEALIKPFDSELCAIMHRYRAMVYYHNHGPIMRWLEPLAALGIDALDPLEAPPWGDCDLRQAKRSIGEGVCLVGNLDDMEVLEQGDTEVVRAMGRQRLAEAGPTGFILGGTASGTYTERAARNFMALVEVTR